MWVSVDFDSDDDRGEGVPLYPPYSLGKINHKRLDGEDSRSLLDQISGMGSVLFSPTFDDPDISPTFDDPRITPT
jgi:hypothetical protein